MIFSKRKQAIRILKTLKERKGKLQFGKNGITWDGSDPKKNLAWEHKQVLIDFLKWMFNIKEEEI